MSAAITPVAYYLYLSPDATDEPSILIGPFRAAHLAADFAFNAPPALHTYLSPGYTPCLALKATADLERTFHDFVLYPDTDSTYDELVDNLGLDLDAQ